MSSSPTVKERTDAIAVAAQRLREAATSRQPCGPVRGLVADGSIASAYAVQRMNNDLAATSGRRVVGWKIGLTSHAVQRQLGVDQPDFGVLFADTWCSDGETVDAGRLLQPRVEAEVAFVLETDLDLPQCTGVDVLRATAFVMPAIEIVDSRIADWDISIIDTVADNASAGLFALGLKPTRVDDVDLRDVAMMLTADGTVVSRGTGADCLGHPVNAVVWLARTLAGLGQPLRSGDVVLSGALGPMVAVTPGAVYEAVVTGLGSVRVGFSEERP